MNLPGWTFRKSPINNTPLDNLAPILLFTLGALVFWALRIYYWSITNEIPFSDMSAYEHIAKGILRNWNFSANKFWQSYRSPVTPLLRATQIFLFGNSLLAWRVFLAALTFIGLSWLVFELIKVTKSKFLAISLLWVAALSKSSIFWSLKIASEGPAEMLAYLSLAATLFALRKKSFFSFMITGLIYAAAFLNKPSYIANPILFLFFFPIFEFLNKRIKSLADFSKIIGLICALILGVVLAWSPWIIRSYMLYGRPCLLNTHQTFTFFWDLRGRIKLDDGKKMPISEIRKNTNFKNDSEFSEHGNYLIRQWLKNNRDYYYKLYWERMRVSAFENWITLTKVSRSQLFPNLLNELLIDKTPVIIISGIIGLLALTILFPNYLYVFPIITLAPWLCSLLFGKHPRYLEPSLPIIFFGVMGIMLLIKKIGKVFYPDSPPKTMGPG